MAQVYVKYNPYKLETYMKVNGKELEKDSTLCSILKGKRLQEWIGEFPRMLVNELNTLDFDIEFYGLSLDWDDFEEAFQQAKKKGIVNRLNLKFLEGRSDDDIKAKVEKIFVELQEGPVDAFREARLQRTFREINNSVFPINVVATMSSGKSTLINALLRKRLMPAKNEACTATITEILDTDADNYTGAAYDSDENELESIPELTYDTMSRLNDDEKVYRIHVEGDIPFLDARSTALRLVDTPGPNNSQNQAHKDATYNSINNDSNNLILYVLNGTQLKTNDDAALLKYVSEQIQKGGKQVRDRFLFVINKMDSFSPQDESVEGAILSARKYLASYGIEDPQIFPCSASTALGIRTHLAGIDIGSLTMDSMDMLPIAAQETFIAARKFNRYESLHLEKYSTLSPSAQRELEYRLKQAEEQGDLKEQALIHCGICSIEAAITAYVKKYAGTKKVKDLVESFHGVLEENQVLANAKDKVSKDEAAAEELSKRKSAVCSKIEDGELAQQFKENVKALNPMDTIEKKADQLQENAVRETSRIFDAYGDTLTSREEVKRLIKQFANLSSDSLAKLTADLTSVINTEIVQVGNTMMEQYQEKLLKFDEGTEGGALDFGTIDLIKGALANMKASSQAWSSDDFAAETVEDVGETTIEEKEYFEKTGQKEEEVRVGEHQEQVGTRRELVGTHRERTGTRTVMKKNPKKRGPFGKLKFWQPDYIEEEEDVYEDVKDYKDVAVYKTVQDYKKVLRDVYEKRTETIEHYTASVATIQTGLIVRYQKSLDDGIKEALEYAKEQIQSVKEQFMESFDELDQQIKSKYEELDACSKNLEEKEEELAHNREVLTWIEGSIKELDEVLEV